MKIFAEKAKLRSHGCLIRGHPIHKVLTLRFRNFRLSPCTLLALAYTPPPPPHLPNKLSGPSWAL